MIGVLLIVSIPIVTPAVIWGLALGIEFVTTSNLPYRLQRRRFRRSERVSCPACHGKPLILIDGDLCREHAVGYDCTGYHGEELMCFGHEERWARIHAKERRVLGEGQSWT